MTEMNPLLRHLRTRYGPRVLQLAVPVTIRSDIRRLGSRYGGWVVPTSLLRNSSICYCAGVGQDITFDIALIGSLGCEVFAFDPTPAAAEHVRLAAAGVEHFHFYPVGLWSSDEMRRFYAPRNAQHVSHSIVNLQRTYSYFEAHCKRVSTLMGELSHTGLDLLKLDIEGAEYAVLTNVLKERIPIRVICVEFDQPTTLKRVITMVRKVMDSGYALVCIDRWNCTFVRNGL